MDRVCLILPIQPGKTEDAREFQRELDGPRKPEYAASERNIGIDKEVWFIASTPSGDQLVAWVARADAARLEIADQHPSPTAWVANLASVR